MVKVATFVLNQLAENTYIIYDEQSLEAAVIDPGCSTDNEEIILTNFIEKNILRLKYILNTHVHIDHILGNAFFKEKYSAMFFCAEADEFLFDIMHSQASAFGFVMKKSPLPDSYITEDLKLRLGDTQLEFLLTPGHSPGGACIYLKSEKMCFTGDLLFRESIGRTDLWGGDYDTLLTSIEEKIFPLPDNVIIYPGHGQPSTVGYEKTSNPFLT